MSSTTDVRRSSGADPACWPDVVAVPRGRVRGAVAARLFRRAVAALPLRVQLPDGSEYGAGGQDAPLMRLRRPGEFYRRLGGSGTIGFGEGYLARDWESDDLVGVLTAFASAAGTLVPAPLQRARHRILSRMPSAERNTIQGAARNIRRHYDLSNEMFAEFLDPTMTYSAALFGTGARPEPGDLTAAQHRKIDRLLDLAGLGSGTRLLEIGTGWGELALRAAGRGAQVHTVTISAEQADLARARIGAAGLADRVTVELRDYRDLDGAGGYDAVVSVEMIEAVGLDHLGTYVEALTRHLAPGGRVALQAITMPDDRMRLSRDTYTWMRKYVFPGGQILSVPAIERALAATDLQITDRFAFGLHYAHTLALWRERFLVRRDAVRALGFDETFLRMWEYYLAYSEAGFRAGYLDVYQFALAREGG